MPEVSVIIPNYNHASYLPKRIESVLNQSYTDFEVILLDDYSTDNSRAIVEDYAKRDNRIHLVFNQSNSGSTFKQWNRGINLAKGKYVWIAESDDYAQKDFLKVLIQKMNQNAKIGLAYTQSYVVDEQNNIIGKTAEWHIPKFRDRYNNSFINIGAEECRNHLVLYNTIPNASAVLFKKEVYRKAGAADDQFKYAGDWLQWAKMLLISDVQYVADPLNFYRWHENSVRKKIATLHLEIEESHKIIDYICAQIHIENNQIIHAYNILLDKWLRQMKETYSFSDVYYKDISEIASKVNVPPESLQRMRYCLLQMWMNELKINSLSIRQNWKIYQSAKYFDKNININLFKKLTKDWLFVKK